MARICRVCGKGAKTVNSRSKSNIATKRLQKPNLQKLKFEGFSILTCTRCLRTLNKAKTIK